MATTCPWVAGQNAGSKGRPSAADLLDIGHQPLSSTVLVLFDQVLPAFPFMFQVAKVFLRNGPENSTRVFVPDFIFLGSAFALGLEHRVVIAQTITRKTRSDTFFIVSRDAKLPGRRFDTEWVLFPVNSPLNKLPIVPGGIVFSLQVIIDEFHSDAFGKVEKPGTCLVSLEDIQNGVNKVARTGPL